MIKYICQKNNGTFYVYYIINLPTKRGGKKMLILNGSAEYMLTEGEQVKGNRHGFNMFVKHDSN